MNMFTNYMIYFTTPFVMCLHLLFKCLILFKGLFGIKNLQHISLLVAGIIFFVNDSIYDIYPNGEVAGYAMDKHRYKWFEE